MKDSFSLLWLDLFYLLIRDFYDEEINVPPLWFILLICSFIFCFLFDIQASASSLKTWLVSYTSGSKQH